MGGAKNPFSENYVMQINYDETRRKAKVIIILAKKDFFSLSFEYKTKEVFPFHLERGTEKSSDEHHAWLQLMHIGSQMQCTEKGRLLCSPF